MEEEQNVAPSAEASAPEPLTIDTALARMNALDNPPEPEPAAPEPSADEEPVAEAEPAEAPEPEAEAKPEADPEDDFVHGNQRTRLRDGTVTTVGELKKLADQAKDYERQLQERSTRDAEAEQRLAQIAAQEQLFTNTVNQAKAILQANAPTKPDFEAYQRGEIDIITFTEQQARWNAYAEKWQQLTRAQQQQAQQAEAKRKEEQTQTIKRETELLREKFPELRTDEGFKTFREEVLSVAPKEYGLKPEELGSIADHRYLSILKDAIAYRKLQAAKPQALEKAKDAPPVQVQAPARRVSTQEKQAQTVKANFDRLRKTGSFDDALAILNSQI